MKHSLALLLSLTLISNACEKSEPVSSVYKKNVPTKTVDKTTLSDPSSKGPVVMVIDSEFDLNMGIYKEQVIGTYTWSCSEDNNADEDRLPTLDEMKKELINEYSMPASKCSLKEGIASQVPEGYSAIENLKDVWNKSFFAKDLSPIASDYEVVTGILMQSSLGMSWHGTSTAGLIAYKNPNVKLVLVQLESLVSADQANASAADEPCPLERLQLLAQAHQDPEVARAFIEQADGEGSLVDLAKKTGVQIVNMSFGTGSRASLEKKLSSTCQGPVDLRNYFEIMGDLERKRASHARPSQDPYLKKILTIQAAGNDGDQVDSFADGWECHDLEDVRILVGSLDAKSEKAAFSNYGKCVDFYTLGQDMIVPTFGGFYLTESGTSFSAPLVVRYLSMNISSTTSPANMIALLKENANADGNLSPTIYPAEISFPQESVGTVQPMENQAPQPDTAERDFMLPSSLKLTTPMEKKKRVLPHFRADNPIRSFQ